MQCDSSEESDYEGKPPVKKPQYPSPVKKSFRQKKVHFSNDGGSESVLPPLPTGIANLKTALSVKMKKKRSVTEQHKRETALCALQKKRKDDFFNQMTQVHELPDLTPNKSNSSPPHGRSDSNKVTILETGEAWDQFKFIPLLLSHVTGLK